MADENTGLIGRRDELTDFFNRRLYHPLSRRIAVALVSSPITPNQLSIAGGICVVAAGLCYTQCGGLVGAATGLMLHLAWHVIDGADGDLARLTGKAGPLGEAIDGISDYFSHFVLYCLFGIMLAQSVGALAWLLVIGAGISRILQTSHQEERRREYEFWVYGRTWIRNEGLERHTFSKKIIGILIDVYLSISDQTNGRNRIGELHETYVAGGSRSSVSFNNTVQHHLLPLLRPLRALGSNQRTIALGAAMLLGQPLWYFGYELLLLNVVLLWSIRAHALAVQRIEAELANGHPGQ
jgi:phosphatidylglycerophosphate synthase